MKSCSVVPHDVVIPILPHTFHRSKGTANNVDVEGQSKTEWTAVRGGRMYKPSKVHLSPYFPLETAYAITVHKAMGRTLEKVIIGLGRHLNRMSEMKYEHIYVAISRVHKCDDMRLLLPGKDPWQQMQSLVYLTELRPDDSMVAFFEGYRGRKETRINGRWMYDIWDSKQALRSLPSGNR